MALGNKLAPLLRYGDARVASNWLCRAFGFELDHIELSRAGEIQYVSLTYGVNCVLVFADNTVLDEFVVQPGTIGGVNTQAVYVTVEDAQSHSDRARASGAKLEFGPKSYDDGYSVYACRDPGGYLWTFGTRAHGAKPDESVPTPRQSLAESAPQTPTARGTRVKLAIAAMLGLVAGSLATLAIEKPSMTGTTASSGSVTAQDSRIGSSSDSRAVSETLQRITESLEQERRAGVDLRGSLNSAHAELARLHQAKEAAAAAIADARADRDKSEQASKDAHAALSTELSNHGQTRATVQSLQSELAQLRHAKDQSDLSASAARTAAHNAEKSHGEATALLQAELMDAKRATLELERELVAVQNELSQRKKSDLDNPACQGNRSGLSRSHGC